MKLATLLLTPLALAFSPAEAQQLFHCNGAVVEIKVLPEPPLATVLTVQQAQRTAILHFSNIDFIGGRCEQDSNGDARIVFQAFCGGSSCHDLDNWGVIDPRSLQVLLIPTEGNRTEAARLLGTAPSPFDHSEMLSIGREVKRLGIDVP